MILKMFSIRDNKTGFLTPVVEQTEAAAIRNFTFALSKPDTLMYSNASDYDLFYLGDFDTDTGTIAETIPKIVISGSSVLINEKE